MLEQFIKFLQGLGNVDDGVECHLTQDCFDALVALTRSVYGDHVATTVEKNFDQREDGSMVCIVEDLGVRFEESLCGYDIDRNNRSRII